MKEVVMMFLVFGITLNLTAQWRTNLDTLNIDQLNVYKDKAVKLRTTGLILTVTGVSIAVVGWISSSIWAGNFEGEGEEGFITLAPMAIGMAVGIPAAIVGIPLFYLGDNRNTKAEMALKKFDIKTDNSMAIGLGITVRF
jgi:hypothetical protein